MRPKLQRATSLFLPPNGDEETTAAWNSSRASFLATLLTGALLAGALVSLLLLPFVAQESDFRVTRRNAGADDESVTLSYTYTQRYHIYVELSKHFPGAHYSVVPISAQPMLDAADLLLFLPTFALATSVCTAHVVPEMILESSQRAVVHAASRADFSWQGGVPNRDEVHRIVAMAKADDFVVLRSSSAVDVIDRRLLPTAHKHECDDGR